VIDTILSLKKSIIRLKKESKMMLKTRPKRPTVIPIRPEGSGYAADGPGYYIWDEDMNEVARMAREFARGTITRTPTTRFMLLREALKVS
jgi:hypothetical protein